jgi:hypothetical protein
MFSSSLAYLERTPPAHVYGWQQPQDSPSSLNFGGGGGGRKREAVENTGGREDGYGVTGGVKRARVEGVEWRREQVRLSLFAPVEQEEE